ncbi:MAG: hypothetical protein JXQ73_14100 [Phycisphaerae bacterium]|nr:hypothetical protein [Phycisphaerae bacterium]
MIDHCILTRRGAKRRLGFGALGLLLCACGLSVPAWADITPPPDLPRTGEPYELLGKRLVFTNWHYVRPGSFAWVDDKGRSVSVVGSQGPWGAHFRRYDYPHGIRLVALRAEKRGPILKFERPWEGKGVNISTLIHHEGKYRGWGGCQTKEGQRYACYFESDDGLDWRRPKLGIVEFGGNKDNNLMEITPGTVFIDPAGPPEERYKAVSEGPVDRDRIEAFTKRRPDAREHRAWRADAGEVFGVLGAVSPDGYRWKRLPDPLAIEHCDTQVVAYYDERLKKYVIYTRNWSVGARSTRAPEDRGLSWLNVARRSIGRTESDNFRDFPLSRIILEPGPSLLPSDTLYTNCKTTIPGAPDHHLLFPTVWHTSDDSCSVVVASSLDGKVWHYLPGEPVLETGPFGAFDGGCVFASPNLVELANGDFVLPYTGYIFPHKYPRGSWKFQTGYAVWPKGRLIALEAVDRGEFATVGVMPPGRKLRINALTKRAGSILVEVVGQNGQVDGDHSFGDCKTIIGDQHWTPVTWKGKDDLGFKEGEFIYLRFRMEKAQLFGLEFE